MTPFFIIAATLVVGAGFLSLAYAFHRIRMLERDLEDERNERRRFREEYRDHYWDMHRAVAAMGLKKMPGKGPEWVKEPS
jgi:hypothetical protein